MHHLSRGHARPRVDRHPPRDRPRRHASFFGWNHRGAYARPFEELIDWLRRDNVFPSGVILLTGTGIVPPDDFSLRSGDIVRITIDGVGTLTNPVVQAALT